MPKYLFISVLFFWIATISFAQNDSSKNLIKTDSSLFKKSTEIKAKSLLIDSSKSNQKKFSINNNQPQKHSPRKATLRSLMLPGWGQAYNKEYWKIPIVWGALSIPAITFVYNNNVYKEAKFANEAKVKASMPNATKADSADYYSLDAKYQRADIFAIQSLRNAARADRDYSVFWFVIIWGLNIVDATVFAHLKEFDVSENLSMNIKPDFNPITRNPGISLQMNVKNKKKSLVFSTR